MKIVKFNNVGICNACESEKNLKIRIVCDEKCYEKIIVDLCNKCANSMIKQLKTTIK